MLTNLVATVVVTMATNFISAQYNWHDISNSTSHVEFREIVETSSFSFMGKTTAIQRTVGIERIEEFRNISDEGIYLHNNPIADYSEHIDPTNAIWHETTTVFTAQPPPFIPSSNWIVDESIVANSWHFYETNSVFNSNLGKDGSWEPLYTKTIIQVFPAQPLTIRTNKIDWNIEPRW